MKYKDIVYEYGENGITEFDLRRSGMAEISDDTQMTLYTAVGLLYGETRAKLRGIGAEMKDYIFMAYQNWYAGQCKYGCVAQGMMKRFNELNVLRTSWIYNNEAMRTSRAPGNTCLSAIATSKGLGTMDNPVNDSKGCGGVMRVAPIGCYFARFNNSKLAATEAAKAAALTHGHALGYIPAAFLGCLICEIIMNQLSGKKFSLKELIIKTENCIKDIFENRVHYDEFEMLIQKAIKLSGEEYADTVAIHELGEGWVAEEALAIAIYSALKHSGSFKETVVCAVNHNGDSDSTGAIAGNIIGAYLGLSGVDTDGSLFNQLEAYDVIFEVSQDLAKGCEMSEYGDYTDVKWMSKYVYCTYGELL